MSLYDTDFMKHRSEGYCRKCRSPKDIGGRCLCGMEHILELAPPITIHRVEQQDSNGCVLACIAMVTGQSYEEVKAGFDRIDAAGISEFRLRAYLAECGYAAAIKYPHYSPLNVDREIWPPKPFGKVHIVFTGNHAIVMLRNGTVYDPAPGHDKPRHIKDYRDIHLMMAVTKL